MARNHAAKIRQGARIVNGRVKPTRSASEQGNYGNSRPKDDQSVKRARQKQNDPRLQRAQQEKERHEAMLVQLDQQLATQEHVPYRATADQPRTGVVMASQLGDDWRPSAHLALVTEKPTEKKPQRREGAVVSFEWDALDLLQQGYHVNKVAQRIGCPPEQLHSLVGKDGYLK